MELIPIPAWTEELRAEFFDITMKDALSVGLTSIHDADSSPEEIMLFKKCVFRYLFYSFTNFSQM